MAYISSTALNQWEGRGLGYDQWLKLQAKYLNKRNSK